MRFILTFFAFCFLFACNDTEKGDTYAGANSMDCHTKGRVLDCVEINPLVGPVDGKTQDSEIFGNGEVEEISWEETAAWFFPSDNHIYGFDIDPLALLPDYVEKGQDVYVSVKTGKLASLRIYVDKKTKTEYHLHKINESKKIVKEDVYTGLDICDNSGCIKEIELPKGDYAVYYGKNDKKRYIHIIEYDEDLKEIDFVKFGEEDNSSCNYGVENGCYTLETVQQRFNDIYKQAVVKGSFIDREPSFFEFDDELYVDLTEEKTVNERMTDYVYQIVKAKDAGLKERLDNYDRLHKKQLDLIEEERIKKEEYENCDYRYTNCSNIEKQYRDLKSKVSSMRSDVENASFSILTYSRQYMWSIHVVLGINEMSIGWDLPDNASGQRYSLENFSDYNRACTIHYKKEYDDNCLNLRFPMLLKNSCGGPDKEIEVEMKDFDKELNTFSLQLHNVNNLSNRCQYTIYAKVHPFVPGAPYALQYTTIISDNFLNGYPQPGGAVIGGLVWGSHVSGENSLNVINHEIGHSYGLSDLYVSKDDPIFAIGKSTDETNLMNYIVPIGPKIRYRPLEVVYTSRNERIKRNGKYATEQQWECIRSNKKCVIQ